MNITEAKEVLNSIGYPVTSNDWEGVIDELHQNYRTHRVGGSMTTLGDAAPLFMRSGNAAFMVDNHGDLHRALVRVKTIQDALKGAELHKMQPEVRSRFLGDIERALENELTVAERVGRVLDCVDKEYSVKYDPESRTQTRKPAQILEDLLSIDTKRINKAVKALKSILVIKTADA